MKKPEKHEHKMGCESNKFGKDFRFCDCGVTIRNNLCYEWEVWHKEETLRILQEIKDSTLFRSCCCGRYVDKQIKELRRIYE